MPKIVKQPTIELRLFPNRILNPRDAGRMTGRVAHTGIISRSARGCHHSPTVFTSRRMVQSSSLPMTLPPSTDSGQFRVTFFFGPDPVNDRPDLSHCVFNVKKRSWKGGVQVSVQLSRDQIARLSQQIGYREWFMTLLTHVSLEDQEPVLERIDDLFVQALCASKLDLAMEQGLEQANQILAADRFGAELEHLARVRPAAITDYVKAELDLAMEQ